MDLVLSLLEVTDEARHHFFCVKAEKISVAPEKRQKIKLIGNRVVAVALDHSDVVRGNMCLRGDLLARETVMLARLAD